MALKSVSITLEYDGNFYDVKPFYGKVLQGYVTAVRALKDGQYTVAIGTPELVDILRDPPGGGSFSYIESGSKMTCSYTLNLDASLGVKLVNQTITAKTTVLNGAVVAPSGNGTFSGTISESDTRTDFQFSAVVNYTGQWNWQYTYDVNERIQTSSSKTWIGSKADLFIGHNENIILEKGIAVRAIPESQYLLMKTHEGGSFEKTDKDGNKLTVKVPVGTMKVLAKGTNEKGQTIYLVRDEVIAASPKVKSTFIHSQHYIENDLLPNLMKLRNSLIYPNDATNDFQALANKYDRVFYKSKVPLSDKTFGDDGTYIAYYPNYDSSLHSDSIQALNQEMAIWLNYLALNEMEKMNVTPDRLVKNYDFDGGATVQYSENFTSARTDGGQIKYPLIQGADLMGNLPSLFSTFEKLKDVNKIDRFTEDPEPQNATVRDGAKNSKTLQAAVAGTGFALKWTPILAYNIKGYNSQARTFNKKVGFTLSTANNGSLNVDVYRTKKNYWDIDTSNKGLDTVNHVKLDTILFVTADNLFWQHAGNTYQPNYADWPVYSNLVFRTRAGATSKPYEDKRLTKWYQPGAVLDVATVPLDRPAIWIDQPIVSNVPFDEPARFIVHFANETDYPNRANRIYNFYLESDSNPLGARVCVDGKTLSSGGEDITLYPIVGPDGKHVVYTKEITVYPSTAYDYEDLAISLYDPDDMARVYTAKFSAHFIPSAGKVNISSPSNNWVVNTESPYDGKRKGWYMPVRIDGFDVNFPGFDHIELQYKLTTQGEKDWVSTCAYYANDSLRTKASGITDTIPSNGIIIAKFYGENDPVEQRYDLRAVNYCRYAGGYLTRSSELLTGIKDTRLPELFGTPEPVNNILGIGDDLKLTFSEPLAANYLSKINNFELLGTPTNNDISTSTSLTFHGNSVAFTQGNRNLAGKSITVDVMLNPAPDKGDMTVFWHGGDENGLMFGLTADRRLSARVNGQTAVSDSIVPFNNALREVAYVLDQSGDNMKVSFFYGSKLIGSKPLKGKYENTDNLHLGYDLTDTSKGYKGDMLEFRLWNHAMTDAALSAYGKKELTGFESGLVDYFRLNEGSGSVSYDRAPGSTDLMLAGTSWTRPNGISVKLDGTKGLVLKPQKFERSAEHDYTLMFWFRTNDTNATLFSNGEATAKTKAANATDQINIGLKDASLYIRSDGWQRNVGATVINGEWHHFIMTVSRSRNLVNVYLDKQMVDAFAADSLAGISGDHIALGATYVDKNTPTNVMKGNIDEVGMFEGALPMQLLNEFTTHTPVSTMTSLMTYLDFGRSERLDDNTMRLEPTGISIKQYKDNQGNVLTRRDTLIASIEPEFVDRETYAPMVSNSKLDNLNFSYVANGNQLLVNIKEPDYTIEKTHVYLTVKELPDLQGNLMASPVTMNVYVYRNPLRWNISHITKNIPYGEGYTFEATVKNLSGERQTYELYDLPVWISASQTSGVINALDEQTITFTVSPYINIGSYNEQIELWSDNDMSEALNVVLNVRGDEPDWKVSDQLKQANRTMMMVARVKIDGVVASSEEDILAVFDDNLQTLGVTHIEVDNTANSNEALAFLNIYGYTNIDGTTPKLNFKFFDASKGKTYTLRVPENLSDLTFQKDAVIGSTAEPVILMNEFIDVQTLKLKEGWNWVTINLIPKDSTTTVRQFLDGSTIWEAGDVIVMVNGTATEKYTCRQSKTAKRGYVWDNADQPINIDPTQMYNIYSMSDKTVSLEGYFPMKQVTMHRDWNRLGYVSTINLPLAQALSNYTDAATEGDVIKSQDGFAVATNSASGIIWKGNLQHMETGKGYMLKRVADKDVSFYYPLYYANSRYNGNLSNRNKVKSDVRTATTMNIVASVSGIDVEEGDKLVAYLGSERKAEAVADEDNNYYLNIGNDTKQTETIYFVMERDGEPVATTGSSISYVADQLLGTPDQPTDISFVNLDQMPKDGKWYTLSGLHLQKKPKRNGLYLFNGEVIIIK